MMKSLILFAALVLCGLDTTAQTTPVGPSSEVLQSCLLGTPIETWTALKLTRDQLRRVQNIQEACKEECSAAGAKKQANPISNADGTTVMSELDNILDDDQYRAWVAYCAGGPGGQAPK
ncbi:MAG: hypothetical protein KA175_03270 [Flavobacteriales bacterium]|nr:hypothetical protein [Flavobacteriales bacterium]MBP6696613.1 hypothetical protein [Flavobacteriales bacterium]